MEDASAFLVGADEASGEHIGDDDALPAAAAEVEMALPPPAVEDDAASTAVAASTAPANWFSEWAQAHNVEEFAQLLQMAGLTSFVETCETALTIFVPTNDAIAKVRHTLPSEPNLLHELLCVHITMGSLRCARAARLRRR